MEGWIKLHRKFEQWEWRDSPNTVSLFIHLLLNAGHKDTRWRGVLVPKGHLITGRKKLSKTLGMSEQSVRTSLIHLKSTNEVTIKATKQYSLIKINNWDEYQLTNQQTNQRPTNDQPTTNHKQEGKKVRMKEKKKPNTSSASADGEYNTSFLMFWDAYPRKIGKGAAWRTWKKIKGVKIFSILEAVANHKRQDQWKKDNGQYIPHPATWLNQRRWEDEIEKPREVVSIT